MKRTGECWFARLGPCYDRALRARARAVLDRAGLKDKTFPHNAEGEKRAREYAARIDALLDEVGITKPRAHVGVQFSIAI